MWIELNIVNKEKGNTRGFDVDVDNIVVDGTLTSDSRWHSNIRFYN